MKKIPLFALLLCFAVAVGFRIVAARAQNGPNAQAPTGPPGGTITKLDPALDQVISPDAKLETLKDDYVNAEGPAWVSKGKSGYLLFSDVTNNTIVKWDPGCEKDFPCPVDAGKSSVYLDHSGYTQAELDAGKISVPTHDGTVGIEVDPQGRVLAAAYGEHGIVRYEKDGTHTILAGTYQDKKFTCPNKLVIKADGAIYFTDPVTTCIKGGDQSPEREMDYHGLFLIKNREVTLLAKDPEGGAPHGITMSPDEKILYVGVGRKILAYDINSDDTVSNERVFIEAGTDGMNVDSKGNVWLAGQGGIWIVSPEGKHLGTIAAPPVKGVRFANMAFGDPDRKTLYIVGNKDLWRIRLKVAGIKQRS